MVTYTNSALYWSPLKPRINVYALDDISYSSPMYTYNPFTDVGVSTKPVSLTFDSQTTNAGSFTLEIEDADSELDFDTFTKGNRVVIDCSKDGSTWQYAFKGLIRSSEQTIYAPTGRNFTLSGYSYIVRLNERVLNVVKESSLVGEEYDRTDTNMFTNNLVENLLDDDQNYVFSSDDFDLYTLPSPADISTSSIQEWLPRLDAELTTVGSAIDSVLEYSNSLITVDLSTDKWAVYNPDLIQPLTQVFLCTDNMNQTADDGDITMYPLDAYKYNVSYDYPDSGSRLIVALNTGGTCPDIVEEQEPQPATFNQFLNGTGTFITGSTDVTRWACIFKASQTDMSNLRIKAGNWNNLSSFTTILAEVRTASGLCTSPGTQIGSTMNLYKDRIPGTPFPEYTTLDWMAGLPSGIAGVTGLTIGSTYWLVCYSGHTLTPGTNNLGWRTNGANMELVDRYTYAKSINAGSSWTVDANCASSDGPLTYFVLDFGTEIIQDACGGSLTTEEIPAPQFVVAHDLNATNRLGIVERAITSLPRHITTLQTINEYLYAKLYVSAKPRFTFDFPSVSMPGKIPKAGDLVTHVSRRAGVGLKTAPLQTGVIMSVNYDFAQGGDGSLGLRRMGLQTTGIRRGSY